VVELRLHIYVYIVRIYIYIYIQRVPKNVYTVYIITVANVYTIFWQGLYIYIIMLSSISDSLSILCLSKAVYRY
jgi:hypothetical protein